MSKYLTAAGWMSHIFSLRCCGSYLCYLMAVLHKLCQKVKDNKTLKQNKKQNKQNEKVKRTGYLNQFINNMYIY